MTEFFFFVPCGFCPQVVLPVTAPLIVEMTLGFLVREVVV